jgi:leucyl-tRNA synthetase
LNRATSEIENLHFNVAVACVHEMSSALASGLSEHAEKASPDMAWAIREAVEIMVQLFSPMMPHLAEECWTVLGHKTLIAEAPWPKVEAALLVEDTITLPVQVNGKKRADVTVARDAGNSEIEAAVLLLDGVQRALEGKAPKKVIVVPQRIVNVVA